MAIYRLFTSTRTTPPDLASVITSLRTSVAPELGLTADSWQRYQAKKDSAFTQADVTIVQSTLDTAPVFDADAAAIDDKDLRACVLGLWECWPNPTMTKVQLRNRILAIRKGL